MSEIKIMVVPGKIARVDLTAGMTVLGACAAAERQVPGVNWSELAKDREVRVQNRKFSNTEEIPGGYFGSISTTPLKDGEVILILTKIKGNDAVLTCFVNGQEYALETPVEARVLLENVMGINLDDVQTILINGDEAEPDRLVGNGDEIEVIYYPEPDKFEPEPKEDETVTVTIDGHVVTGRPQDIKRILSC